MSNIIENTEDNESELSLAEAKQGKKVTLSSRIKINAESGVKERDELLRKKISIEEGEKNLFLAIKQHIMRQEENIPAASVEQVKKSKPPAESRQIAHVIIDLPVEDVNIRKPIIEGSLRRSRGESIISRDSRKFKVTFGDPEIRRKSQLSKAPDSKASSKASVAEDTDLEDEKKEQEEKGSDHSSDSTTCEYKSFRGVCKEENMKILNVVERERKRQQEKKSVINKMRKNLPIYNLMQIRELRLPYHEAVFVNMEDKYYVHSVAFGKELLAFQENLRKNEPQGSAALVKPLLRYDREQFTILMQSLKTAEDFHRQDKLLEECEEFLKLSIVFAFADTDDWWWLGEQILVQTIKISSSYACKIGNKYEALSRYTYGRYLLEKLKEFKNASAQLKISRLLAEGKGWSGKAYFPELRGTLFMQCNHGIYNCLIREVKYYMGNQDYYKAIVLAEQARKRAAEACYKNGETQALVLRGICEMETDHLKSSISSLLRAYSIQDRFGTVEGLCKIRIHLAKAYLMDKCTNSSLNVLLDLKRDAENYNLPYYLGLAYKNLGQYYLLIGENSKALPLLQQSLKIFKKCDTSTPAFKEIESTKTLRDISGGLQLFPKYIDLLVDVDNFGIVGPNSLEKLLLWKENRTDFWDDTDHLVTYDSCEDILEESMKRVAQSRANFFDKKLKEVARQ